MKVVNVGEAFVGVAVVLVGVIIVLITPKLDRVVQRFAVPGVRAPSTPFYTPWRWWARMVGIGWIAIGLLLTLQATIHRL